MGIEVVEATGERFDRWDDYLERAPDPSPFHRRTYLELVESHSDATLRPLVGYKGEEPIGLLPVFEREFGPFTFAHSPLTGMQIGYMGPLRLNAERCKQRRRERDNDRFIEASLEWIDDELDPAFIYLRCTPWYDDVRPFIWHDDEFEVTPEYTFFVDLTRGEDELLDSFAKNTRKRISTAVDAGCEIREAEREDVERVIDHYLSRHPRDDYFDEEFALEFYESAGGEVVGGHAVYLDDEYVGGSVNLVGGDTIYGWLGAAAPEADVPVNELLYWRTMQHGIDRGYERLDLLGATQQNLSSFKSKFNPELRPTYKVKWLTPQLNVAKKVRERLPTAITPSIY